jgi:glutaredoxin
MYTTSWCPVCKEAKAWFLRNNVPFEEYDVEKDPDREREYKKLSGKGVPLILIGDNQLSGWSETRVRNWLGMNK